MEHDAGIMMAPICPHLISLRTTPHLYLRTSHSSFSHHCWAWMMAIWLWAYELSTVSKKRRDEAFQYYVRKDIDGLRRAVGRPLTVRPDVFLSPPSLATRRSFHRHCAQSVLASSMTVNAVGPCTSSSSPSIKLLNWLCVLFATALPRIVGEKVRSRLCNIVLVGYSFVVVFLVGTLCAGCCGRASLVGPCVNCCSYRCPWRRQ